MTLAAALTLAVGASRAATAEEGAPGADPDGPVRRLIARLREPAHRLRVDGKDDDWDGFPVAADPKGDTAAGGARDILGVALAVRETDVVVLLRTASAPDGAEGAFVLDVDFLGLAARDAEIRLAPGGAAQVRVLPERAAALVRATTLVETKVGRVVEVRIPLLVITSWMPAGAGEGFLRGERRPWVRVQPRSVDAAGATLDLGPAVAAYRLRDGDFPLDGAAPAEGEHRRPLPLPLDGRWFVRQGGFGLWSHADHWAYDLAIVDGTLTSSPGTDGRRKEDFLAWDRPVRAPEGGRIVLAHADEADHEPSEPRAGLSRGTRSNQVVIGFADGLRLYFEHLREGSVPVTKGDNVAAGTLVGRVGNSGASGAPHIHLALHDRPGEFTGLPMTLRDVRVSLNAGDDDPWARELPAWEVREGLFVERLEPFKGSAPASR